MSEKSIITIVCVWFCSITIISSLIIIYVGIDNMIGLLGAYWMINLTGFLMYKFQDSMFK